MLPVSSLLMINFKHECIFPNSCYLFDILDNLCLFLLDYEQLFRMYCIIIFFCLTHYKFAFNGNACKCSRHGILILISAVYPFKFILLFYFYFLVLFAGEEMGFTACVPIFQTCELVTKACRTF